MEWVANAAKAAVESADATNSRQVTWFASDIGLSLGLNRLVIQVWHLPFHEVVGAEASFLDMHPGKKFSTKSRWSSALSEQALHSLLHKT
jgi:hypothetical protein